MGMMVTPKSTAKDEIEKRGTQLVRVCITKGIGDKEGKMEAVAGEGEKKGKKKLFGGFGKIPRRKHVRKR